MFVHAFLIGGEQRPNRQNFSVKSGILLSSWDSATRFSKIFYQKTIPGPQLNMQKRLREMFCFREDIFEKRVSA